MGNLSPLRCPFCALTMMSVVGKRSKRLKRCPRCKMSFFHYQRNYYVKIRDIGLLRK